MQDGGLVDLHGQQVALRHGQRAVDLDRPQVGQGQRVVVGNALYLGPVGFWQFASRMADLVLQRAGVDLGDFVTQPAQVRRIDPPSLWPRTPPIRVRQSVPDSWLEIIIHEGKNRQVRRMTAKVGHPTLRLVRAAIGPWSLGDLPPGELRQLTVSAPPLANGGKPAHHDRAMSRADRPAPPRPGVRARHPGRRR